jgi:hypothetical protein
MKSALLYLVWFLVVAISIEFVVASPKSRKSRREEQKKLQKEFGKVFPKEASMNEEGNAGGAETAVTRWPSAAGRNKDEVILEIQTERPNMKVVAVKEGSMVTMDFRTDRVRVYHAEDGSVVGIPSVG